MSKEFHEDIPRTEENEFLFHSILDDLGEEENEEKHSSK